MPDPWNLYFSIIFGLIGCSYMIYGKKTGSGPFLIGGVGLVVYTFAVNSTAAVIWWGIGLAILPFVLQAFFD